ncbi:hypothetical protein H1R20_g10725, partial [Candolleomyces eurysporus]
MTQIQEEFIHPPLDGSARLAIAIRILQAVHAGADAFPPLKSAVGLVLTIAQTAESFKNNKEEWKNLSAHIQLYMAAILKHLTDDRTGKLKAYTELLTKLKSKEVRDTIVQILRADDTLCLASPCRQMKDVIIPAFRKSLPQAGPLVIVIDGLDEADDRDLWNILRNDIPDLPSSICIVATSRPEPNAMSFLGDQGHVSLLSTSLIGRSETLSDIEQHVRKRLHEPPFRNFNPSDQLIRQFVSMTEGLFLWAEVNLKFLEQSIDPVKALEEIVDRSEKGFEVEGKLDALFDQIFSKIAWNKGAATAFKALMAPLVTQEVKISKQALLALHAINPAVNSKDIDTMASWLGSVLLDAPGSPIQLFHLSVMEFLTKRESESKPYFLNVEECHYTMAILTLDSILKDLRPGVPPLGFLSLHLGEKPKIMQIPPSLSDETLWYSCISFQYHVLGSGQKADLDLARKLRDVLVQLLDPLLEITAMWGEVTDVPALLRWVQSTFPDHFEDLFNDDDYHRIGTSLFAMYDWLYSSERVDEYHNALQGAITIFRHLNARKIAGADQILVEYLAVHATWCNLCRGSAHPEATEALEIYRLFEGKEEVVHQKCRGAVFLALATTHHAQNDQREAVEYLKEAVTAYRQLVGAGNHEYAASLASTLAVQGEMLKGADDQAGALDSARECLEMVLELTKKDYRTISALGARVSNAQPTVPEAVMYGPGLRLSLTRAYKTAIPWMNGEITGRLLHWSI